MRNPQNPVLIIKAPTLIEEAFAVVKSTRREDLNDLYSSGFRVQGFRVPLKGPIRVPIWALKGSIKGLVLARAKPVNPRPLNRKLKSTMTSKPEALTACSPKLTILNPGNPGALNSKSSRALDKVQTYEPPQKCLETR